MIRLHLKIPLVCKHENQHQLNGYCLRCGASTIKQWYNLAANGKVSMCSSGSIMGCTMALSDETFVYVDEYCGLTQ